MKRIFFVLLFLTQFFYAQNAFETGNNLYKQGNYSAAIQQYESILKNKKHSAELYFNIANCYYKLNKVAPSIYYFEKALLLNPNDKEIQNNLEFAQKLQIDDIKILPKVGFAKLIQNVTSTFSYNNWAWVSVGLATLFLLLFLGYYFSQITLAKRIFFVGMFLLLLFIVISILSAIFEKTRHENDKPAIVFDEVVSLKSEPKSTSSDVIVVHEGSKVLVEDALDNWRKVQLTDGTQGWIEQKAIKELKD